jgi:hypothetical protein
MKVVIVKTIDFENFNLTLLGTKVGFFTKIETPYGLSLSLRLPCDQTEGSNCTIHLKDKLKVRYLYGIIIILSFKTFPC